MPRKTYVCPTCGDSFGTPQGLGSHRARSHGYKSGDDDVVNMAHRPEEIGPQNEVITGEHRLIAEAVLEAQEQGLIELVELDLDDFHEELERFLPLLAQEARDRFRRGDVTLVDPFLTLFLDLPDQRHRDLRLVPMVEPVD